MDSKLYSIHPCLDEIIFINRLKTSVLGRHYSGHFEDSNTNKVELPVHKEPHGRHRDFKATWEAEYLGVYSGL